MKLSEIYNKAVEIGITRDLRGRDAVDKLLEDEKDNFQKLEGEEREFFDKDRLFNPFADTRILNGDPENEVRKIMLGIDIQVGELLLAHVLNRDKGKEIDLVISHHPEGRALAQLYDVMKLQADVLALYGINISVAEKLMEKRINEVERRLLPVNHTRTTDAAGLLGFPFLCVHTPADNCVTSYLKQKFESAEPRRLKEVMDILKDEPEYKKAAGTLSLPKILNGSESNTCGRIFVDMTGGTGGSKDIFDKFAASGVSTLVGMHMSEEHLENAKKANLNVIIAGHIASDTLGLNLLFDELEKDGKLDFVCVSGFERIRRPLL